MPDTDTSDTSYERLMAPAFQEIMLVSNAQIVGDATQPEMRAENLTDLIINRVAQVDWAASGLPSRSVMRRGRPVILDPSEAADVFARAAIDDARILIRGCQWACVDAGQPHLPADHRSFGGRLVVARTAMTQASRLADNYRTALFWGLADKETTPRTMGERLTAPPIALTTPSEGQPGFAWSPQVARWIERHVDQRRGCPARKIRSYGQDGAMMPLPDALWDKLVRVMYLPEQPNQTVTQR